MIGRTSQIFSVVHVLVCVVVYVTQMCCLIFVLSALDVMLYLITIMKNEEICVDDYPHAHRHCVVSMQHFFVNADQPNGLVALIT